MKSWLQHIEREEEKRYKGCEEKCVFNVSSETWPLAEFYLLLQPNPHVHKLKTKILSLGMYVVIDCPWLFLVGRQVAWTLSISYLL